LNGPGRGTSIAARVFSDEFIHPSIRGLRPALERFEV